MLLTEVPPLVAQPVKSPLSNPPLTITLAGAGLTSNVTLAVWLRLPLLPVMVIVYVPVVAVLPVVAVSVDEPPPAIDAGLNDPDAPAPKPMAPSVTALPNPLVAVTVTV